jgi:hypothetical protein
MLGYSLEGYRTAWGKGSGPMGIVGTESDEALNGVWDSKNFMPSMSGWSAADRGGGPEGRRGGGGGVGSGGKKGESRDRLQLGRGPEDGLDLGAQIAAEKHQSQQGWRIGIGLNPLIESSRNSLENATPIHSFSTTRGTTAIMLTSPLLGA